MHQYIVPVMAIFLFLASAGTAYPASGQNQDVPRSADDNIQVAYVTLRNKTGNPGFEDYFGEKRGQMRSGVCSVSFSPIPGLEEVADSAPFYVPDERIELADIREMDPGSFFSRVSEFARRDNGSIVVYVHGYNIDFEKSCRRSAIFQRALGLDERLVLFSWPSDGNMLKYTWDESDLLWSVPHMAEFLREMLRRTGKGRIDIVAHSLGARGMVQALVRLASRQEDVPLFNELILIAPDIDTEIFRQELPLFRDAVKRLTLYVSENDRALKLSHEVHGYPRLGEAGEYLTVLPEVETIDISGISLRRMSGHLYHLFNPEVISDLTRLLHTGEPADQRPSLKSAGKNGRTYWRLLPEDE
jgi:esterase/lipase superfamily enzyme